MIREDLLALTPEAVAALANVGLVKRAQREIAEGKGPALAIDDSGTVTGTFEGNVVAKLVPKKALRDCPCTCGAVTVCRHRVATALAYPAWARGGDDVAKAAATDPAATPWSPADLSDDSLLTFVGKRTLDRATATARAGLVVTVVPWSASDRTPTARLPSCTVRFHVPNDLAYARCDCVVGTACEHVPLAVWAFREASRAGALDAARTVSLGKGRDAAAGDAAEALDAARSIAIEVLRLGYSHAPPAMATRFAEARAALEREKLVWPLDTLEAIERNVAAYQTRSARYDEKLGARLLVEIFARRRAARASDAELPPRFVLGEGQPRETPLDHLRLVSLGARLEADETAREAEVFLADADSGDVLVWERRWDFTSEASPPPSGPELARRLALPGVTLTALGHGQVVTRAAKRRANGLVLFGQNKSHTSVTPQRGDWDHLPAPLLARDFGELEAHLKAAAPRMLRPRVLGEGFHVIAIAGVDAVAYVPAEQRVIVRVRDEAGATMYLEREHKTVAPHLVDAVAAAAESGLRFAAGPVRRTSHGLVLEPLALATKDAVVVPDLAASPAAHSAAPIVERGREDAIGGALTRLETLVGEVAHVGLASLPRSFDARAARTAAELHGLGLLRLAHAAERFRASLSGASDSSVIAADRFADLGILTELARELA